MEILRVEHLCKTYGSGAARVEALRDVSFRMEKGEFAAVTGESGSGKSTLLHCIGGLEEATAGRVVIDGQVLGTMTEEERTVFRRRRIGFVFQSFHLIRELDVVNNLCFPLLLDHRRPDMEKAEEIMEVLGLTERRFHLPDELSGGQQQRVAIGRALMTRPMLLLADEPTGNLDSRNSEEVMELLQRASRRFQQTILMITHNENLAASVDRVLRISDGRLTDLGRREESWEREKQERRGGHTWIYGEGAAEKEQEAGAEAEQSADEATAEASRLANGKRGARV